jgi:hypothetical protein
MTDPVQPLADGTIVVHAGFHKTGTTALQSALASSRPDLLAAGVLYPGELRSHHRAAMAVTERTWGWESRGGRPPKASYWTSVRDNATGHDGRVVISSEALSLASDAVVDRMVDELGKDRLHAVFTLRPFARLLASSYQQYLKYGLAMPYVEWLKNVFADPPACPPSPNFWKRNDHASVMQRWADRLGPDRVSLLVVDEADRGWLMRTFEALIGVPAGTLVPDPAISAGNRSMTAGEAELLRLVNAGGANTWDWPAYQNSVRRGAIMRMVESRTPGRGEPMLATPPWAVQAAQEVGAATAQRVQQMGIHVLGDVARLGEAIPAAEPQETGVMIPAEAAAEALLGGIIGASDGLLAKADVSRVISEAKQEAAEAAREEAVEEAVARMTAREAVQVLRDRLAHARRWRLKRLRRSLSGGRRGGQGREQGEPARAGQSATVGEPAGVG